VAQFFLDNNVTGALHALLVGDGHTMFTSRGEGIASGDDITQVLAATDRDAICVTHDTEDFLLVHRTWLALAARWQQADEHAGIIVLPQEGESELHRYLADFVQSRRPTRNIYWRYRPSDGWTQR
jgi:hypothetical protein